MTRTIKVLMGVIALLLAAAVILLLFIWLDIVPANGITEEMKSYTFTEAVTELDIEISAANVYVKSGDSLRVESNLKYLSVYVKDGVLHAEETRNVKIHSTAATFTLFLPAGTVFDNAEITTGAGKFTVDDFSAKELSLRLGAGAVEIENITVYDKAEINGGTGKVTVENGSLTNLELEMGVGELDMTVALTGDCHLEMGVGKALLSLKGDPNDYALGLEKGIGTITVDGNQMPNGSLVGNGANKVEVEGGVGNVEIFFAE